MVFRVFTCIDNFNAKHALEAFAIDDNPDDVFVAHCGMCGIFAILERFDLKIIPVFGNLFLLCGDISSFGVIVLHE